MYKRVYPREKYLSKIRPFFDSDIIKVINGIRRCGKSYIIKGIINELLAGGVELRLREMGKKLGVEKVYIINGHKRECNDNVLTRNK